MKILPYRSLLAILLTMAFCLPARADKADVDKLNKKIDNFALKTAEGNTFSLDDVKDKKAVVVLFLSFECPVSNGYAPTLVDLHKKYGDKVAFVAVNSGDDITPSELAKKAKEFDLPFTVLADDKAKVADAFQAKIAPEVFVLDHNRVLRYRGRIDNLYSARLKKSAKVTEHDLKNALDDVLVGKDVRKPATVAIGCPIQRERETKKDGKVTFYRDVLPILQNQCQSCHRPGEVGPFSLMNYKQAVAWADDIKSFTQSKQMPPWKPIEGVEFHNERKLSAKELKTLADWVEDNTPAGDPKDAPKAKEFTDGWQLGKPDLVLTVQDDFVLGPSGKDLFRVFVLPTGLKEDKMVIAWDVRPGNKRVVHHTLNFFDLTGRGREMEKAEKDRTKKAGEPDTGPGYSTSMGLGFLPTSGKNGTVAGWAPGQMPRLLPGNYGYPLPAESDLLVQTHYHRNGRTEKDRLQVGLYFAKDTKGMLPLKAAILPGKFFIIPAGEANYKVNGNIETLEDGVLHTVMPHMHLLGKQIKVTMTEPGGKPQTLINITDWNYNWQETYFLKKPIPIKKGTKFTVDAVFDNSAKNPNNPFTPPQWVRLGEQTDNEMCFVFLGVTGDEAKRSFRFSVEGINLRPITDAKKDEKRDESKK